jgi:hypothetical protein
MGKSGSSSQLAKLLVESYVTLMVRIGLARPRSFNSRKPLFMQSKFYKDINVLRG